MAKPNAYYLCLEALRRSGVTNMYGAAPYLAVEFGCTKSEAIAILIDWIKNYRREDYEDVNLSEVGAWEL